MSKHLIKKFPLAFTLHDDDEKFLSLLFNIKGLISFSCAFQT